MSPIRMRDRASTELDCQKTMKGIIFNLLEEVVVSHHGEDTWDQLLTATSLDGAYTSLGSYPDGHVQKLVAAASQTLGLTPFEVLRWFGRCAIPLLFDRYPGFFSTQPSTRPFLLSVNGIIHPEVRKVYPGADVPTFEFRDEIDGSLTMGYHSPRRLCALAQGFIEGAATHYGETVILEHRECMHNGDKRCLCNISFSSGLSP
jgi:heme-NO-binding protein